VRVARAVLTAAALLVLAATGCGGGGPLYRWGHYEGVLYDTYAHPGKADPATQIARLSEDVQRAQAEGERVPPGVHAHLGYMYYLQGNAEAAARELQTEKELFPESAVFIDRLLARLAAPAAP